MKKNLLILFFMALFVLTAHNKVLAQYSASQNNLSLQFHAGSQGLGADFRYGFSDKLSARAGASFLPVKANNIFTFSSIQATTNASAKFSNIHLLADFVPFENLQFIRLVGGAGYLFNATGGLEFLPSGTYKVGNYNITSEELGKLNVDVSWKGVAPYIGIGLFKSFPANRFNINLDLGSYYLSQPKSTVVGTNMLSDNNQLEPQFNANMSSYRWMPVLQLNFNFKINGSGN